MLSEIFSLYFQSISRQGDVILCGDAICGLGLTYFITISFVPLLRHEERPRYSAESPLKTCVQHFPPELTQHREPFTPSEKAHKIPGETVLFVGCE